jgi:uncharacterized protein (DUF433 family)
MIDGDFNGTVWRDPERRGGRACLKGTRFTIAQLIAEHTKPSDVAEVAENLDLDKAQIRKFFAALAKRFDEVTGA